MTETFGNWTAEDARAGRCQIEDIGDPRPVEVPPPGAALFGEKSRAADFSAAPDDLDALADGLGAPLPQRADYPTTSAWLNAIKELEARLAERALADAHDDAAREGGDALAKVAKLRRARKLLEESEAIANADQPAEQFTVIIEGMDGQPIDLSNRYDRQFYQTETGEWGNRHLDELQARDPADAQITDVVAKLPAPEPETPPAPPEQPQDGPPPWKATNPTSIEAARRHGAAVALGRLLKS